MMNREGRPTAPQGGAVSAHQTFTGARALQVEEPLIFETGRLDVTGVVHTPNGAHFTECPPDYGRDEAFMKEYAASAKSPEAWTAFYDRYIAVDHKGFLAAMEQRS